MERTILHDGGEEGKKGRRDKMHLKHDALRGTVSCMDGLPLLT